MLFLTCRVFTVKPTCVCLMVNVTKLNQVYSIISKIQWIPWNLSKQNLLRTNLFYNRQVFGLYRLNNKNFLDFDLFWTVLFGVQFYSGFSFIRGSVLFRVQFYSGFSFIQGSVLFRIQFYSGFSFIRGSVLFRVRLRQVSQFELTNISSVGTLFKIWFIQDFVW
jgi:hypothetical protein